MTHFGHASKNFVAVIWTQPPLEPRLRFGKLLLEGFGVSLQTKQSCREGGLFVPVSEQKREP